MPTRSREGRIAAVAAIREPLRRSVYELVAAAGGPVSRDEAAEQLDLPRSTAAFHLDRLADAGLLAVEYRRPEGRSGPGAGRPAKLYRPADVELAVSVPERHYDLMAEVLAEAIERAGNGDARDALAESARERGRQLGAGRSLDEALEQAGYHPVTEDDRIVLANCPFHRLAARHTELVCAANLALVEGLAESSAGAGCSAAFTPGPGHCCVTLIHSTSVQETSS